MRRIGFEKMLRKIAKPISGYSFRFKVARESTENGTQ